MKPLRLTSFIAALALLMGASALGASARLTGTWQGNLTVAPDASLRLVFNLTDDKATLDSPDQNTYGIPVEVVCNSADSVNLRVTRIGLTYAGRLVNGALKGMFTQGALNVPLTLEPSAPLQATPATAARRPQDPTGQRPYSEQEVAAHSNPSTLLAGTLTMPDGRVAGQIPVVLLISGSGLQNRDEEVFNHRPFAVWADQLARAGIATLRYDDRSVGKSTGDASAATTADFADDARAWLPLLRSMGFATVGALGHSEGARIAMALAPELDFVVTLGLPAQRGDSILVAQNRVALAESGVDAPVADEYCNALATLLATVAQQGQAPADLPGAVAALTDSWGNSPQEMALAGNLMAVGRELASTPWLTAFVADSPAADIAACRVPALALYGALDTQVAAPANPDAARSLNPAIDVRVMPGLNHLMQPATTGSVSEYEKIDITVAPEAIEAVTTFINGQPR